MRAYLLYVASATCMTARHFPKHGILERGKLQAPVMYAQLLHASIFRNTLRVLPGQESQKHAGCSTWRAEGPLAVDSVCNIINNLPACRRLSKELKV